MEVIDIQPITQTTSETSYIDGRPCFGPDGKTVLFERNGGDILRSEFWTVDIETKTPATPYYTSDQYSCFRAAWSWNPNQHNGQIAFTANYPNGVSKIMLLDENGPSNSAQELVVQGYQVNTRLSYPAWYANEMALLITDYSSLSLIKATINGTFLGVVSSRTKWAGMGTVSAKNSNVIAYAGQGVNDKGYHQDVNQIWIERPGNMPTLFSSKNGIGRGPWISPDGRIMAYEGTENGTSGNLQIFLKEITPPYTNKALPVSNANHNSLHAKFSPDGKKIVWAQHMSSNKAQIFMATIIT